MFGFLTASQLRGDPIACDAEDTRFRLALRVARARSFRFNAAGIRRHAQLSPCLGQSVVWRQPVHYITSELLSVLRVFRMLAHNKIN